MTYQVASEGLLDHDDGVHFSLLAAVARPHLRQLPGGDGGHRRPPTAISHAVPRLREAPPPLLYRWPDDTAGARGMVLLVIPDPFLLASEHLLEPPHCAAHGVAVLLAARTDASKSGAGAKKDARKELVR